MDGQTVDPVPSVSDVLHGRKRGKVCSHTDKSRKAIAVVKGVPLRLKVTGSNKCSSTRKLRSVKCTAALNPAQDDSEGSHPVMVGEQSNSQVSDDVQMIAAVQCIEESKDGPKGIDGCPGTASEPTFFQENHNECMIHLDSIEPTEARFDSTQGELPTDCSDHTSTKIKAMLMAAVSLSTVVQEMEKEVLTTNANRLKSAQHASWSREDAAESSSTSSNNASNVSNTHLQEKISHLFEWLGSSEHASSYGESQIEGSAPFDGNPSYAGTSGCNGIVKPLASEYQNVSSSRKYLTSEFSDVGAADAEGELTSVGGIIQEVSSFAENGNSASKDDTCDGGTATSEGKSLCTVMPSKQVSSCMENLSETASGSNNSTFEGKIACTTLLSEHPSSCAERLNVSPSASYDNMVDASTKSPHGKRVRKPNLKSKKNVTSDKRPASANLCSIIPLSVNLGYRCDSVELLRQHLASGSLPKDTDAGCKGKTKSGDPSASNDNRLDVGATSPQGNITCANNTLHHASSHIDKLPDMSPPDSQACNVLTTDRSDNVKSLVGISSQHAKGCGENLSENSVTFYTSTGKFPINVNNETRCKIPSKRVSTGCKDKTKSRHPSSSNDNGLDFGVTSLRCNLTRATNASPHVLSHVEKESEMYPPDHNSSDVITTKHSDNLTSVIGISSKHPQSSRKKLTEKSVTFCISTEKSPFHNNETRHKLFSKCARKRNIKNKKRIAPDKRPASADLFSIVPLSINLGNRCDSMELLRQHHASRSLPKDADIEHEDKTKDIEPSALKDSTLDAGKTSPQANITCATNASNHFSSHIGKLTEISPDNQTCDYTTDCSDDLTNVIEISSQHAQSCGDNLRENSITSYNSMEKSPICVNSETPSSKRIQKQNSKSKSRITSDEETAKANVCPTLPLSVNLGYRCDSSEFLRQSHPSRFLLKNADTGCKDKRKNGNPPALIDNMLDTATTPPQGNLTCATNALHNFSSEKSFTSRTSTGKSLINVNNASRCSSSLKPVCKLNLKSKRRLSSNKRPAGANLASIVPLRVSLGYRCDSVEFSRQHNTARSMPKDAVHKDKPVSHDFQQEGVSSENEQPTSSVPVDKPENNNPRIFSLDIIHKINLLSLALGKSFSASVDANSLLIGSDDSNKTTSRMIRRDYPKPNERHVCRCFYRSLRLSPSDGESSITLHEH